MRLLKSRIAAIERMVQAKGHNQALAKEQQRIYTMIMKDEPQTTPLHVRGQNLTEQQNIYLSIMGGDGDVESYARGREHLGLPN